MSDAPEHTGFLGLYTGPIEVGMTFLWEPNKPHAREVLTVVRIQERPNDEPAIWTDKTIWNDESRFREAVVALPEPTPAQIMADPLVKALVEALRAAAEDLDDYSPLTGNAIETSAAKRCRAAIAAFKEPKP